MTNLKEIIPVLQGIADGGTLEVCHGDGAWFSPPGGGLDSVAHYTKIGYKIRLKPDFYADLKAAHARGEVIQTLCGDSFKDDPFPSFTLPLNYYRIKPREEWVPLTVDDVPPGSVIRNLKVWTTLVWATIRNVQKDGVQIHETHFYFQGLMEDGYEILRPGSTEWVPCKKLKD